MSGEDQEPLASADISKLSVSDSNDDDSDVDYVAEPTLTRRHTSFGKDGEDEEDDDDVMPEPTGLIRATSAPAGEGAEKSPFQRQRRRVNRKSLRQQNPNHRLHTLLPEEMKETEETDEASALARAQEMRRLLLAKRNKQESGEEEENEEEEVEKVPTKEASANSAHRTHSRKDSVASSVSSISAGPLTPASADTVHSATAVAPKEPFHPDTITNQDTAFTTSPQEKTKRPVNLDQFFEMKRHRELQRFEREGLPPTPPTSPLHRLASTGGDMSVAEESLLPYSGSSVDGSIGLDLASLDGSTTVTSYGASGALLKGYHENLSKQLSELQKLCEQDNHVDNEDEHSTFTNPESRARAKQGKSNDDASSASSDSSGNLLRRMPLPNSDIRLTGRSLVLNETDDESSCLSQTERLGSERLDAHREEEGDDHESSDVSDNLQRMPADLRLTGRSVVLEEEEDESQEVDLPQSEQPDASKQAVAEEVDAIGESSNADDITASQALHQTVFEQEETMSEEEVDEPVVNQNAPPTPQAMHRGASKEEEKEATDDDKALAEMKTPKKSNRSSQNTTKTTDENDEDSDGLEDLYQTDKWGRADMKGNDEAAAVVVDDNNHVSTTAKVALATVAVVAGFCVRTFSRHRG